MSAIDAIDRDTPVLIAGPTASGKSALALEIAERQGGVIINADALQVYSCWRVLSARPSAEEEARAPHHLYGHVAPGQDYSTGHWLREVAPLLSGPRPIIVGGTGLYFTALTEGLAEIPALPPGTRTLAETRIASDGIETLARDLARHDPETFQGLDAQNPARIQRAWEVWKGTGRGLKSWQADQAPPLLPLTNCTPILMAAERDWLATRIATRFERMIEAGALDEVRAMQPLWAPRAPWAQAIGAPELIAHLRDEITLAEAINKAVIVSRQYAKRQRTWFRARMKDWRRIELP